MFVIIFTQMVCQFTDTTSEYGGIHSTARKVEDVTRETTGRKTKGTTWRRQVDKMEDVRETKGRLQGDNRGIQQRDTKKGDIVETAQETGRKTTGTLEGRPTGGRRETRKADGRETNGDEWVRQREDTRETKEKRKGDKNGHKGDKRERKGRQQGGRGKTKGRQKGLRSETEGRHQRETCRRHTKG